MCITQPINCFFGYKSSINCVHLLKKKLLQTKAVTKPEIFFASHLLLSLHLCPEGSFLFTSTNGVQDERRIQGPQGHFSDLWYVISINMCGFLACFHTKRKYAWICDDFQKILKVQLPFFQWSRSIRWRSVIPLM